MQMQAYAAEVAAEAAKRQTKIEAKLAELEAQNEALKRAFERRSEQKKKMPPPPKAPRTSAEVVEHRRQQAQLRAENVETVEVPLPVPDELKKCPLCDGSDFRPVGHGKPTDTWSFVPGHFRRRVHLRETVACRCGGHVVTAPPPERWSDKTRYDESFAAYLVVSKCMMSLPLYRTEGEFKRLGVPIARSTMNDLFRRAAQRLMPLRAPLLAAIRAKEIIHADETPFKLTTQKAKAFIWAFRATNLVLYEFALSRGGEVPSDVLGESTGILVCDDYRGYDSVCALGFRTRGGCLAHARRKFFDANKDGTPEAERALELIAALYIVEHEADRREALGIDDRLALRKQFSRPLYAELFRLCRSIKRVHGPKTLLARAANYTLSNWRELTVCLRDARVPLDNNTAENAIRILALGRKNFLFVQSEEAGKELALLYSLVVSCDRLGINPVTYLTDVLRRIGHTNESALADLLPGRWEPPSGQAATAEPFAPD